MEFIAKILVLAIFMKYADSEPSRTRNFFSNSPISSQKSRAFVLPNSEETHQSLKLRHHVDRVDDDFMLFPSDDSSKGAPLSREDKGFSREAGVVDDGEDYPATQIRRLLDQNPLLKQYFTPIIPDLGTRFNDEGMEDLCEMRTQRLFYPKKLRNVQNQEVFVVNDDKKGYLQLVEFKECGAKNMKCKYDIPDVFGYTSLCVQKYETRQLMVYSNATDKLLFDQFKVPTCCVCMVKKT